ncbi:hypothetical protein JFL47_04185 [Haemophilus haemoglobinophilus]|nr:hypothetical protein [Canicola haemoglobinophilus]
MKKVLIAVLAVFLVVSCGNRADRNASRIAKREARLAKETAFTLGVDPSAVQVSNVSGNAYGYRWRATTGGKNYNCSIMGGNFFTWGQTVAPPQCHFIGSAGKSKKKK